MSPNNARAFHCCCCLHQPCWLCPSPHNQPPQRQHWGLWLVQACTHLLPWPQSALQPCQPFWIGGIHCLALSAACHLCCWLLLLSTTHTKSTSGYLCWDVRVEVLQLLEYKLSQEAGKKSNQWTFLSFRDVSVNLCSSLLIDMNMYSGLCFMMACSQTCMPWQCQGWRGKIQLDRCHRFQSVWSIGYFETDTNNKSSLNR